MLGHIFHLGVKELRSLYRDPIMMFLIAFAFTGMVYTAARAIPETLHNASIAIVDEDRSPLSNRITDAFYPPYFTQPFLISQNQVDPGLDAGRYTFVLDIPPNFQSDVLAGRKPAVQLNVDANRMTQAFSGNGYIQQILNTEVGAFLQRYRGLAGPPADLAIRIRFNPTLAQIWFGAVMQVINNVAMLSIILTGAALMVEFQGRPPRLHRHIPLRAEWPG